MLLASTSLMSAPTMAQAGQSRWVAAFVCDSQQQCCCQLTFALNASSVQHVPQSTESMEACMPCPCRACLRLYSCWVLPSRPCLVMTSSFAPRLASMHQVGHRHCGHHVGSTVLDVAAFHPNLLMHAHMGSPVALFRLRTAASKPCGRARVTLLLRDPSFVPRASGTFVHVLS
jgi:hypothetical protein